jgi:hypothetical protein
MLRLTLLSLLLCTPVSASAFEKVQEKEQLLAAVDGRELSIGIFRLSIVVSPDGSLSGQAMGWDMTGNWTWENGLFCRKMDWSGYEIEQDCQLVEKSGNKLRFTSDAGEGRSAVFTLQ